MPSDLNTRVQISTYPLPPLDQQTSNTHTKLPNDVLQEHKELLAEASTGEHQEMPLQSAKCILLGSMSVGKTAICRRVAHGEFDMRYKPTIGLDFVDIRCDMFGVPFNLNIWDTAGEERFRSLSNSYYRGSDCIIMVFDVNDEKTVQELPGWYKEVTENCPPDVLIFLVGNKIDLPRNARSEDITEMRRCISDAEYWETSARLNTNVSELTQRVATLCYEKRVKQRIQNKESFESTKLDIDIRKLHKKMKDMNNGGQAKQQSSGKCC